MTAVRSPLVLAGLAVWTLLLLQLQLQPHSGAAAQNTWCQSTKCSTPDLMDVTTFRTSAGGLGVLTVSSDGSYCISQDAGLTWTYNAGIRPQLSSLTSIASTMPGSVNQSVIVTASNCRAMYSGNNLTSFELTGAPCINDFVVSAMSPSGLNAAATDTYNRIWFSYDAGRTWPATSTLWSGLRYNQFFITMLTFATDSVLVAIGGYNGVYDGYRQYTARWAHPLFLWSLDGGVTTRNQYIYHPYDGVVLNDVSCVQLSCLAVGTYTVIYQISFAAANADPSITQLPSPATGVVRNLELSAVWCVSNQQCWIGGQAGFLAMTTDGGQTWQTATMSGFYSAFIYSIRCQDAQSCFLVMRQGVVFTNSGVCTSQPIPAPPIAGFAGGAALSPSMLLVAVAALLGVVLAF